MVNNTRNETSRCNAANKSQIFDMTYLNDSTLYVVLKIDSIIFIFWFLFSEGLEYLVFCPDILLFPAFTMQAAMGTMDYIIDTVSAVHALAPLIGLLKLNGKLVTVGLPDKPLELPIFPLVLGMPI